MLNRLLTNLSPSTSLIGRFAIASLIILPIFIAVSGTLFFNAFQHSQLKSEQEKLQSQLYLLLSNTEIINKKTTLPEALTEPRFNQQNSGLYGLIYNRQGQEIWRSPSALLLNESFFNSDHPFEVNTNHFFERTISPELALNIFSYDLEWINEDDSVLQLRYVIASDNAPLTAELNSYQKRTWQWLGAMALLLIIAQLIIMKWGLKPLKRLSYQLSELQDNTIQQLDNDYPIEVLPVIKNFNSILEQEKLQRERYRNTMSDLAHSLKTPLAVIQSQLDSDNVADNSSTNNGSDNGSDNGSNNSINDKQDSISEQVHRINQIVEHQLKRAVIKVSQNSLHQQSQKIELHTLLERLIKILGKVYAEKNIQFNNLVDKDVVCWGDEGDFLEVIGNILDNACKYGDDKVTIIVVSVHPILALQISDNGKGIADSHKHTILKRGARGDTLQAGQGIGLTVAADIISSYGGGLQVFNNMSEPHLSGACFCISLPNLKN